jgi:7-cyano-7-deazaguanine synthase
VNAVAALAPEFLVKTPTTHRPLILFGGGLDSCALVEFYHHLNPVLLYFRYGQKSEVGEMRALHYFSTKYQLTTAVIVLDPSTIPASPLTVLDVVAAKEDHAQNYIPGRNLLFSSMAFSYAESKGLRPIMLGASPAPPESEFYDAKTEFARTFNRLVADTYPDAAAWLEMPLVEDVRAEYLGRALKTEPNLFGVSFTCYESRTETECGKCVHCQQKAELRRQLILGG